MCVCDFITNTLMPLLPSLHFSLPPSRPLPPSLILQFTLYFHTTLSEHSSIHDMKHLSSKLDRDYIVLMYTLSRQIQAHCVLLMFDSNGLPDFKGPKYSFPNSPSPVLTGINSYPFMVSIPHVRTWVSIPYICIYKCTAYVHV